MTRTEFTENSPVISTADPGRGVGLAIRMWGSTAVEVLWPGARYTRREPVGDVKVYVAPVSTPKRRTRRGA